MNPYHHYNNENHHQQMLTVPQIFSLMYANMAPRVPGAPPPSFHVPRHLPFTVEPMRLRRHDDHFQPPRVSIPDDLMEAEILPRLPAKSVLRFRSVSKAWNDMTRSSRFAKQHLAHQRSERSLFMNYGSTVCTMELGSDGTTMVTTLIANLKPLLGGPPTIVGSCNGLFCLASIDWRVVYVCNPIINEFLSLPPAIHDYPLSFIQYGIGFDDINSEFKVLRFMVGLANQQWSFEAAVYAIQTTRTTSRQESWKVLPDAPSGQREINEMVFVDGRLYSSCREMVTRNHSILSFDVRDEQFGEIAFPSCMNDESSRRLWELDGCLSCVRWVFDEMVEVWKMKEHGGNQLWTKEHSIRFQVSELCNSWRWQQWQDDEVIGLSREQGVLVAYNLRSGAESKFRYVISDGDGGDPLGFWLRDVVRHAPSLFSVGERSIQ